MFSKELTVQLAVYVRLLKSNLLWWSQDNSIRLLSPLEWITLTPFQQLCLIIKNAADYNEFESKFSVSFASSSELEFFNNLNLSAEFGQVVQFAEVQISEFANDKEDTICSLLKYIRQIYINDISEACLFSNTDNVEFFQKVYSLLSQKTVGSEFNFGTVREFAHLSNILVSIPSKMLELNGKNFESVVTLIDYFSTSNDNWFNFLSVNWLLDGKVISKSSRFDLLLLHCLHSVLRTKCKYQIKLIRNGVEMKCGGVEKLETSFSPRLLSCTHSMAFMHYPDKIKEFVDVVSPDITAKLFLIGYLEMHHFEQKKIPLPVKLFVNIPELPIFKLVLSVSSMSNPTVPEEKRILQSSVCAALLVINSCFLIDSTADVGLSLLWKFMENTPTQIEDSLNENSSIDDYYNCHRTELLKIGQDLESLNLSLALCDVFEGYWEILNPDSEDISRVLHPSLSSLHFYPHEFYLNDKKGVYLLSLESSKSKCSTLLSSVLSARRKVNNTDISFTMFEKTIAILCNELGFRSFDQNKEEYLQTWIRLCEDIREFCGVIDAYHFKIANSLNRTISAPSGSIVEYSFKKSVLLPYSDQFPVEISYCKQNIGLIIAESLLHFKLEDSILASYIDEIGLPESFLTFFNVDVNIICQLVLNKSIELFNGVKSLLVSADKVLSNQDTKSIYRYLQNPVEYDDLIRSECLLDILPSNEKWAQSILHETSLHMLLKIIIDYNISNNDLVDVVPAQLRTPSTVGLLEIIFKCSPLFYKSASILSVCEREGYTVSYRSKVFGDQSEDECVHADIDGNSILYWKSMEKMNSNVSGTIDSFNSMSGGTSSGVDYLISLFVDIGFHDLYTEPKNESFRIMNSLEYVCVIIDVIAVLIGNCLRNCDISTSVSLCQLVFKVFQKSIYLYKSVQNETVMMELASFRPRLLKQKESIGAVVEQLVAILDTNIRVELIQQEDSINDDLQQSSSSSPEILLPLCPSFIKKRLLLLQWIDLLCFSNSEPDKLCVFVKSSCCNTVETFRCPVIAKDVSVAQLVDSFQFERISFDSISVTCNDTDEMLVSLAKQCIAFIVCKILNSRGNQCVEFDGTSIIEHRSNKKRNSTLKDKIVSMVKEEDDVLGFRKHLRKLKQDSSGRIQSSVSSTSVDENVSIQAFSMVPVNVNLLLDRFYEFHSHMLINKMEKEFLFPYISDLVCWLSMLSSESLAHNLLNDFVVYLEDKMRSVKSHGDGMEASKTLNLDVLNSEISQKILKRLTPLGYSENAAKRAVVSTGGGSFEVAFAWIMEHASDSDLDSPLIPSSELIKTTKGVDSAVPDSQRFKLAIKFIACVSSGLTVAQRDNLHSDVMNSTSTNSGIMPVETSEMGANPILSLEKPTEDDLTFETFSANKIDPFVYSEVKTSSSPPRIQLSKQQEALRRLQDIADLQAFFVKIGEKLSVNLPVCASEIFEAIDYLEKVPELTLQDEHDSSVFSKVLDTLVCVDDVKLKNVRCVVLKIIQSLHIISNSNCQIFNRNFLLEFLKSWPVLPNCLSLNCCVLYYIEFHIESKNSILALSQFWMNCLNWIKPDLEIDYNATPVLVSQFKCGYSADQDEVCSSLLWHCCAVRLSSCFYCDSLISFDNNFNSNEYQVSWQELHSSSSLDDIVSVLAKYPTRFFVLVVALYEHFIQIPRIPDNISKFSLKRNDSLDMCTPLEDLKKICVDILLGNSSSVSRNPHELSLLEFVKFIGCSMPRFDASAIVDEVKSLVKIINDDIALLKRIGRVLGMHQKYFLNYYSWESGSLEKICHVLNISKLLQSSTIAGQRKLIYIKNRANLDVKVMAKHELCGVLCAENFQNWHRALGRSLQLSLSEIMLLTLINSVNSFIAEMSELPSDELNNKTDELQLEMNSLLKKMDYQDVLAFSGFLADVKPISLVSLSKDSLNFDNDHRLSNSIESIELLDLFVLNSFIVRGKSVYSILLEDICLLLRDPKGNALNGGRMIEIIEYFVLPVSKIFQAEVFPSIDLKSESRLMKEFWNSLGSSFQTKYRHACMDINESVKIQSVFARYILKKIFHIGLFDPTTVLEGLALPLVMKSDISVISLDKLSKFLLEYSKLLNLQKRRIPCSDVLQSNKLLTVDKFAHSYDLLNDYNYYVLLLSNLIFAECINLDDANCFVAVRNLLKYMELYIENAVNYEPVCMFMITGILDIILSGIQKSKNISSISKGKEYFYEVQIGSVACNESIGMFRSLLSELDSVMIIMEEIRSDLLQTLVVELQFIFIITQSYNDFLIELCNAAVDDEEITENLLENLIKVRFLPSCLRDKLNSVELDAHLEFIFYVNSGKDTELLVGFLIKMTHTLPVSKVITVILKYIRSCYCSYLNIDCLYTSQEVLSDLSSIFHRVHEMPYVHCDVVIANIGANNRVLVEEYFQTLVSMLQQFLHKEKSLGLDCIIALCLDVLLVDLAVLNNLSDELNWNRSNLMINKLLDCLNGFNITTWKSVSLLKALVGLLSQLLTTYKDQSKDLLSNFVFKQEYSGILTSFSSQPPVDALLPLNISCVLVLLTCCVPLIWLKASPKLGGMIREFICRANTNIFSGVKSDSSFVSSIFSWWNGELRLTSSLLTQQCWIQYYLKYGMRFEAAEISFSQRNFILLEKWRDDKKEKSEAVKSHWESNNCLKLLHNTPRAVETLQYSAEV